MDTIAMTAVYPHDAAYARAHGELAAYRNARRRNIACKDAIEEAIAKHFDGMHLDEACVKEVLDKRWALEREIPREPDRWSAYAVAAHPVILNDFINLARQEMQKRERPPAAKIKEAIRQPCTKAFQERE